MKLPIDFYRSNALDVAKSLLGKELVRVVNNETLISKIVETEAYIGPEDKGCHAFNNKKTKRTEVMFEPGGVAYVYVIYGIHHCLNIVTGRSPMC
ncbi:DNA-3-methyladenine glycosylase [Proteinivorax hydrogeniformans]|uniref:DNA-3-methyladenine glycosylase n=1 Tax=Proteinivorax hydrogeniformans TaxID=1826727 RepID=A0AAU8HX40_9FIRM